MSDLFLHWTLDNNSVCQSVPLSLINVMAYAAFHFPCAHVNARYGFKICSEGTGNNVSDEQTLDISMPDDDELQGCSQQSLA